MAERGLGVFTSPGLASAAILLLTWSFMTFVVRLWVKLRKDCRWGADDNAISVALFTASAHVASVCTATRHGYGGDWQDISTDDRLIALKAFYASQILYVASVGLTRISMCFFVISLALEQRLKQAVKLVMGLCACLALAHILVVAIRGSFAEPWFTLDGTQSLYKRWLFVEVSGLVLEFALWAVGVCLIWRLHMPTRKRCSVSAILAVRFLLIPPVALRLLYLFPPADPNSMPPAVTAAIYTELSLQFSIMLSSVTCARPFLRTFHSEYFIGTTGSGNKTLGYLRESNSTTDNWFQMISKRSNRSQTLPISNDNDTAPLNAALVHQFRPEQISHYTKSTVDNTAPSPQHQRGKKAILRTDSWAITYE